MENSEFVSGFEKFIQDNLEKLISSLPAGERIYQEQIVQLIDDMREEVLSQAEAFIHTHQWIAVVDKYCEVVDEHFESAVETHGDGEVVEYDLFVKVLTELPEKLKKVNSEVFPMTV